MGLFGESKKTDSTLEIDHKKSLEEIVKELETKTRIYELDLERRIIFLEKEIENISHILKGIGDKESLELLLKNSKEIKEKLRDLEDLKYVEHLELADALDKIKNIYVEFENINEKYNLIKHALEKVPELNEFALKFKSKYTEMEKEIHLLESQVYEIKNSYAKTEDITKIKDYMRKLHAQITQTHEHMKDLTKEYKEYIELIEKKISKHNETYKKAENLLKNYKRYDEEIEKLKKAIDNVAKKLLDFEKEQFNRDLSKIEYAFKRYEKALNLVETQIKHLKEQINQNPSEKYAELSKEFDSKIKELKNLHNALNKLIKSKKIEHVENVSKILSKGNKIFQEYDKKLKNLEESIEKTNKKINEIESRLEEFATKNEIKEIKYQLQNIPQSANNPHIKELLDLSLKLNKQLNQKIKENNKYLENKISSLVKQKLDELYDKELIQYLRSELLNEVTALISTHEIDEHHKIKALKEYEGYIQEQIDKLKEELLLYIASKKSENESEIHIKLKAEVEDLKRKLAQLAKENQELKEKIESKPAPENYGISTHPYIIE